MRSSVVLKALILFESLRRRDKFQPPYMSAVATGDHRTSSSFRPIRRMQFSLAFYLRVDGTMIARNSRAPFVAAMGRAPGCFLGVHGCLSARSICQLCLADRSHSPLARHGSSGACIRVLICESSCREKRAGALHILYQRENTIFGAPRVTSAQNPGHCHPSAVPVFRRPFLPRRNCPRCPLSKSGMRLDLVPPRSGLFGLAPLFAAFGDRYAESYMGSWLLHEALSVCAARWEVQYTCSLRHEPFYI